MVHALKRGLVISDFNKMSVGMILDYIGRYDGFTKEVEKDIKQADQKEFNNF